MVYRRKIYKMIADWKQFSQGKSALLIQGARRIGKSTIVSAFSENEYKRYILIDFSVASQEIKELFNDLSDLNYIFL